MKPPRTIVHLDADAFFAAVEQAADPKLRGKPVAVGGEKRGIIASASYEARKFGVYTPMPTIRARKLCPKLIVLPGDFERYEQFSTWMFGYAFDFTPDVEQTSIDEGYFDLTANHKKSAVEIALTIRQAIRQGLKITVSEGIGTSKLVSAVASKLTKPAAFQAVPAGREAAFLHPLSNKWLPGIGLKTSVRLNAAGLAQIRHIAATPLEMLSLLLGRQAAIIHQYARGIDERPLVPAREPQKSFSQQQTFGQDLTDEDYIEATLRRMADQLFASVRSEGRSIRTLTVKVRYNDMAEDQSSESLIEPTDLEADVYGRLHGMLRAAWKRRVSLRLVSLKLSNVYDGRFRSELPLEVSAQRQDAQVRLAAAIDELRGTRGASVVLRGHDLILRDAPREALSPEPIRKVRAVTYRRPVTPKAAAPYIPLRVHSHYSFLASTLSPTAIIALAQKYDLPAVALTDRGNLHGAVEFVQAAKQAGVKPIIGAELRLGDHPLLLYVESPRGYHNLCRMLSRHAERMANKGDGASTANQQRGAILRCDLEGLTEGLIAISSDVTCADLFPRRFYRLITSRDTPPDFFHRVAPSAEELEAMIRAGAFDEFGNTRTRQFWQAQHLVKTYGVSTAPDQCWLIPPPGLELSPAVPLAEPTRLERLQSETELFGFAVSGHPLELFPDIAWDTYCPLNQLRDFAGEIVTTCGLIVEQRTHHQVTGEPMKFLSIADWTGIVETELFAPTYRTYGLATVRYPVLEIEARVEPFENGRGLTLRALRAGAPRIRTL